MQSAVRLANHLKADNLKVFVNPVVVWVSEAGNSWQVEKLSKEEREKVIFKLSKLVDYHFCPPYTECDV